MDISTPFHTPDARPIPGSRPIVVRPNVYGHRHVITPHVHDRAQFLSALRGTMTVRAPRSVWIVPPSRALWLPAGLPHAVEMHGSVQMRSVYFDRRIGDLPEGCTVLAMTPLLRELVERAATLPSHYDEEGEDGLLMRLLLAEIRRLPRCGLTLPLPEADDLRALCDALLDRLRHAGPAPDDALPLPRVSPRTLYRRFLRETGISFTRWQRQAMLQEAVRRLSAGQAVTEVALDLGYESPSAFSAMFRRVLGMPPRAFVAGAGVASPLTPPVATPGTGPG